MTMTHISNPPTMQLKVKAMERLHPMIASVVLVSPDGGALPAFEPGSHVRVQVTLADGSQDWRHYSLVNLEPNADALSHPAAYRLGVRLEDGGRGGSRFMHALRAGDTVIVQAPRNEFPAGPTIGPALLLAGGIGVTPITALAAECRRTGRPVRMVYASRSRSQLAFVDGLRDLLGDSLSLHVDDEAGRSLDAASLLASCARDETVYVCGPQPMLDAVFAAADQLGWTRDRVRFELFSAPQPQDGDRAFEVVLQQSGRTLHVGSEESILQCMEAAGCDPLADCRRGECGVCAVDVLEGEIDHRDHVLTPAEKAAGKVIQICVSRAKGPRLVLDY